MSSLKTNEKQILEKLFQMGGGYVLNFSDRTMGEFFRDNLGVDIYANQYRYASGSKANCMRGFWNEADDEMVAKSIVELVDYINSQILIENLKSETFPERLITRALEIAADLGGVEAQQESQTEKQFIKKEFDISLEALGFDREFTDILRKRFEEIQICLGSNAPMAVLFLCGSTLEGVLLGVAAKYPQLFNQSVCAPEKNGKVLPFHDWTLSNFIDVGKDVQFLGEDVKKFSHSLRHFRNYMHPYEQLTSRFNPHAHTARISWQVLQAAIYEVTQAQKKQRA